MKHPFITSRTYIQHNNSRFLVCMEAGANDVLKSYSVATSLEAVAMLFTGHVTN